MEALMHAASSLEDFFDFAQGITLSAIPFFLTA
jgi:hypothetical protein